MLHCHGQLPQTYLDCIDRLAAMETQYLNRVVVLDMVAPYVYLGTLVALDDHYYVLEQADVHDLRDSTTTRELYILDSRKHGVSVNRERVCINRNQVVSFSALDDVLV